MTWNSATKRWFKKWNGKQYATSQRTLKKAFPHLYEAPTKEGSYRAANQWWADKLATLQQHPHEAQLDEAVEQRKLAAEWCCLAGEEDTRKQLLREVDQLNEAKRNGTPLTQNEMGLGLQLEGIVLNLACRVAGSASDWGARIEEAKRHLTFNQQQLGTSLALLIDKYLKQKETEVAPKRYRGIKRDVEDFQDWWKCDNVELLKGLVLAEYRQHLITTCKSAATASSKMKNIKGLVNWLYDTAEAIDLPRNMKRLTISVEDTENPTFSVEQVKTLFKVSSEEQKLHYLLMLNCGMYQGDVSQLLKSELDLEAGTITRRRSKRQNGGLTVTYQLWDVTAELLKKYVSNDPSLVLTDADGSALYIEHGTHETDKIGNRYKALKDKHNLPRLKDLRKTGATLRGQNSRWTWGVSRSNLTMI